MIVGLADELASRCADTLTDNGVRVLKVGHVAAACERMPVVMPQLVVIPTTLRPEEEETIADRCVAVGAEMLKVAPETDANALRVMLKDAATNAVVRALRGGR
jgi:hypothetical protein